MSSEALWFEICPCCEGSGKMGGVSGTRRGKSAILEIGYGAEKPCVACGGKGQVLICKKIRKTK